MHTAADQLLDCPPRFDQLTASYLPMIHRIAAAHEANVATRQDRVQDILCAVWRALPDFRDEGHLRAFRLRAPSVRSEWPTWAFTRY